LKYRLIVLGSRGLDQIQKIYNTPACVEIKSTLGETVHRKTTLSRSQRDCGDTSQVKTGSVDNWRTTTGRSCPLEVHYMQTEDVPTDGLLPDHMVGPYPAFKSVAVDIFGPIALGGTIKKASQLFTATSRFLGKFVETLQTAS
jgi:hypothetical protein